MAVEARERMNLRHVPLWVVREMARTESHKPWVADTLAQVIQRPDELGEFLKLYWLADEGKADKQPLSAQVKKGLARAYTKFGAYGLAKYNQDNAIKLRDVMFLVHPTPKDADTVQDLQIANAVNKGKYKRGAVLRHNAGQGKLWQQLVTNSLPTPDTWEVALSAGGNRPEVWTRLINEDKLGALAYIRNLRNMANAHVDPAVVKAGLLKLNTRRVLPFRFVAAAKAAPAYETELDQLLVRSAIENGQITGRTVVVIDVSGSMYNKPVSSKSDMDRALAACAMGAIAREMFPDSGIYATAGSDAKHIHATVEVPGRHGMALVDAIFAQCHPLGGGGIFLTQVCNWLREREKNVARMIVITDEQDCSDPRVRSDAPTNATPLGKNNYMINVNTYEHGIGYDPKWTHIDGWSEAVLNYIAACEDPSALNGEPNDPDEE